MTHRYGFSFSTFGKSRKVLKKATDIISCVHSLQDKPQVPLSSEIAYPDGSFWGIVCRELGISNTLSNRTRIKNAYLKHQQIKTPTDQTKDVDVQEKTAEEAQAEADTEPSTVHDSQELTSLWKQKDTEVVVAVLPSHIRGNNLVIHHSDLRTLRPHQWLTGEVIEGIFHLSAHEYKTIYILNHYTAGVILFAERHEVRRHALSKINFDNYQAVLSFVNTEGVHWKLLYILPATSSVFLVDSAANPKEQQQSEEAAKRVQQYFNMRRICYSKEDWGTVKWKGMTMHHPVQGDSSSCGVIVSMMARAVMEAFPALPVMSFGTSKKEMAHQRRKLAFSILNGSVFDMENNCAMCSVSKAPGSGPPITDWIQCGTCDRWFHEQCLGMDDSQCKKARASDWSCSICTQ